MLWPKIIRPAQRRFRRQRAKLIAERFPGVQGSTIVDVGGALPFWREVSDIIRPAKVLIFNISAGRTTLGETGADWIETHIYDGHRLPLADGEADFVFCNSVIEHVPVEQRASFAAELRRVGKTLFVQTPSIAFPLELHFGLPLVHWLPRKWGRMLVRWSPFELFTDANAQRYFDQTQLLPRSELESYFPGTEIVIERFAGIPKSMVAVTR